ncbi:hypothetical protein HBI40_039650 [Parastagonospora nodorum]|nr:hypothetical protein HBH52_051360 [Parastagonospora nodorum]KAH4990094.1 hypothetical protein HBI76_064390 [Parastagonospora nodorum]KAH6105806.1 hypothetical protein HBI65_032470 [Parastagonospora nodorum]KAH6266425.1 hypothetical protein HBI41_101960 [Parastagonospora nodorum]KAH6299920.1 hypothetical protein HBI40_039650 [Parastagonospora nodorum]
MSKPEVPTLPYASKSDFLAIGLWATTLDKPLDCSICREPLATSETTQSHVPEIEGAALYRFPILPCNNLHPIPNARAPSPDDDPIPESPVRISPCNHIFGSTCLHSWFKNSTSNRCPECNTTLFPPHIHLAMRRPTRAIRLEFASFIERDMQDEETALMIRRTLSSERVGVLIREFAIEMHRASGFEVSWEYVGGGEEEEVDEDLMEGASGGEEDEDILEGEDEEMESGSEYEPEGEDGDDEEEEEDHEDYN